MQNRCIYDLSFKRLVKKASVKKFKMKREFSLAWLSQIHRFQQCIRYRYLLLHFSSPSITLGGYVSLRHRINQDWTLDSGPDSRLLTLDSTLYMFYKHGIEKCDRTGGGWVGVRRVAVGRYRIYVFPLISTTFFLSFFCLYKHVTLSSYHRTTIHKGL